MAAPRRSRLGELELELGSASARAHLASARELNLAMDAPAPEALAACEASFALAH